MSEAVSALNNAYAKGAITVQEVGPQGMITLRGDLSDAAFGAAVAQVTGASVPGQRKITHAGANAVAWMSPDELLILLPYAEVGAAVSSLNAALAGTHFLAVNVSDARALFRVTGKPGPVREVIAKLAPADLSPDAFALGDIRRTRLAQVAAAFWLTQEGEANLVCFRSVARYAFDLLATSAAAGPVGFFRQG
ncbi:sarcosine oxidase subunit gamma [Thalassobius vesicularis]|uniref:Sarcosine oxidase subunit gamma n=1 Tax=Thalassobius vesicularis TaxID=1294297 RepID=A0A4S3M9B4_9RHOB|nr:sarcosine oxidase subunit gamma family protein [Thalassobius vesicularis]THD72661.1 sarcosine oxidase subunit gamma [Thalassobius vesicularis]